MVYEKIAPTFGSRVLTYQKVLIYLHDIPFLHIILQDNARYTVHYILYNSSCNYLNDTETDIYKLLV